MRRLGAAFLLLGLTAPALAVEPPATEEPPSVPWYRWLFLGERAKPVPPKPAIVNKAAAAPTGKEAAARTLAEEQRVFLERLKAISKIKEIALDQGNEELLRRAEELEEQAEEVFRQRTARMQGTADDRAALERGRDDRQATAARTAPRRPATRGGER
jgi:hypothetical protein